jgi:hypothetical protein
VGARWMGEHDPIHIDRWGRRRVAAEISTTCASFANVIQIDLRTEIVSRTHVLLRWRYRLVLATCEEFLGLKSD